MRRKLAAGNWKMNGLTASLAEARGIAQSHPSPTVDILLCPPATLLAPMANIAKGTALALGGQDCHAAQSGAHTGDISAPMLADVGATAVILGHSERRENHKESDEQIRAKAEAAWAAGLTSIICIGESEAQRDANKTLDIIGGQLSGSVPEGMTGKTLVIAYEPIWAIGTGRTPTLEQIAEVHDFIRAQMEQRFGAEGTAIRLLYGGSVKPSNAKEIFAVSNVDGALVGGASLKAADFTGIITALEAAG